MEAAAAALNVIGLIVDLIKQAETASSEKHAEIMARLAACESALTGAQTAAHASKTADDADMQSALDEAAKKP